MQNADHWLAY